ncbi:MAG TPA: hypothetical protein VNT56_02965 [Acidimicrobiales bacterium]|nr:hypothetical protein [Acidimicrobiales bacterium]
MSVPRLLPMLAGGEGVPSRPEHYLLEPKLDGQRVVITVEGGEVVLSNRRGSEITPTYPELGELGEVLGTQAAVLDGEVVAFDRHGRASFGRLQQRMHVMRPSPVLVSECPVAFAAFDVLWLDGRSLVERPQSERREVLDGLGLRGRWWQTVPVLDATPAEALEACRALGLEGYMAKRRDAPYLPGRRSPAWRKVKHVRRRELVVGGWSPGQGNRASSIGSLALGAYDVGLAEAERRGQGQRLLYVGQAGSGLSQAVIAQLRTLFDQIGDEESPFTPAPPLPLHHVRPLLVVEVGYAEVTTDGVLRHPRVQGLRTDVVATDVVVDGDLAGVGGARPC